MKHICTMTILAALLCFAPVANASESLQEQKRVTCYDDLQAVLAERHKTVEAQIAAAARLKEYARRMKAIQGILVPENNSEWGMDLVKPGYSDPMPQRKYSYSNPNPFMTQTVAS